MAGIKKKARKGGGGAPRHKIIWFTGQSGAGKSTLAFLLQKRVGGVVLDGDEMREAISKGAGFGRKDRHDHNIRVARLAYALSKQTNVIVAVIAPFARTRKEITALIDPTWIYLRRGREKNGSNYPYEIPKNPHFSFDTDYSPTSESINAIVRSLKNKSQ